MPLVNNLRHFYYDKNYSGLFIFIPAFSLKPSAYSYRRASTGSNFAAFLAG